MNTKFSNASLDDLFGPDEAWRQPQLSTPELEELYEAVHERGLDWSDPSRGVRAARACIELVDLCDLVADADTRTSYLMQAIRIDPFDDDVLGDYLLEVSQTGYRCADSRSASSLGASAQPRAVASWPCCTRGSSCSVVGRTCLFARRFSSPFRWESPERLWRTRERNGVLV